MSLSLPSSGDSRLAALPVAAHHAQFTVLRSQETRNQARYRLARRRGQERYWQEGYYLDPDRRPIRGRRQRRVVEDEHRYGQATWSQARIANDGSAEVCHEGRWSTWRPERRPPGAVLRPANAALRRSTRTRGAGRPATRRVRRTSGSRGDPSESTEGDGDDPPSPGPLEHLNRLRFAAYRLASYLAGMGS